MRGPGKTPAAAHSTVSRAKLVAPQLLEQALGYSQALATRGRTKITKASGYSQHGLVLLDFLESQLAVLIDIHLLEEVINAIQTIL